MDVSFDEAKLLRKTISPLFLIKPYPTYTEVKALDPNVRLSTALKMQENWLAKELNTKKLKWLLFNQMSMKSHIILILYFVFFIASLIFCLLNYPPACYITNFLQKNIGHSDEIFMLTWLIFIIPITLIIRKIDRSLKHLI
ncbi:MAG: hypothetical protein H6607_03230 [Flavobacteriales bacterium]|nr:hypothetical protein [Flavobacteriales bacterium]